MVKLRLIMIKTPTCRRSITFLHLELSMIIYDQTKLREIVNNYHSNKDFRYKRLPIEAIKTIKDPQAESQKEETPIYMSEEAGR